MENKPASLDQIILQVGEMVELIQKHKGPLISNFTPQIYEQIDQLEKAVALFREASENSMENAGIDIAKLKEGSKDSPHISPRGKKLLLQADHITEDANLLQMALSNSIKREGVSKKTKKPQEKEHKLRSKERKKMFKSIGGDEKWIPL